MYVISGYIWLDSLPMVDLIYVDCNSGAIWHCEATAFINFTSRGWMIHLLLFLLQLGLSMHPFRVYLRVSWVFVLLIIICIIFLLYRVLQVGYADNSSINWHSPCWVVNIFLQHCSSSLPCFLLSMAFSPDARAQTSNTRPFQHNWPNPFLRPAANEPPKVVNINGLTITVDRNETHIPVPRPPSHFLNHYQNFCLVGKIFGQPVSATVVHDKCLANWQGLQGSVTIERLGNLWFRIEFTQEEDLVYVLDNRPWFVKGRIFHLRRWTPSFSATIAKIDNLIVWVRLPFLPLHL